MAELGEINTQTELGTPPFASTGNVEYDAYVPDDFATPGAAFADVSAPKSVYVRDGVYTETQDVMIPKDGSLIGESPDGTILNLSGGYEVGADGSGIDYSTGTISATNGSATVTGAGTLWQTAGVSAGDFILVGVGDKCWTMIASVDSETQITLSRVWRGQTTAGEAYEIKSLISGITVRDITLLNNTSGPGLSITNVFASRLQDVNVVGCGQAATDPAVLIQDTVDSFFQSLIVIASEHHGIEINDSNANTFDSFNVKGANGHGIQVTGANQDCTFNSGNICACDQNGFNVAGGSDETLINNCVISENVGIGVNVEAGTGDCHVRNTTIRNNEGNGIDFDGGGNSATGCQVSSNTGNGIVCEDNTVISGCYVRGNGVGGTADGIRLEGDDNIVSGCRSASNSDEGIEVDGDNNVITGCRVEGNSGDGLLINGTANDTIVTGCNMFGNTGTNFSDSGVATVTAANKS